MNGFSRVKTNWQEVKINEWLSSHGQRLIDCPYQQGNLKITISSCRKRRRKANQIVFQTNPGSFFEYAFEQSLKLCKHCDQSFLSDLSSVPEKSEYYPPSRLRKPYRNRISVPEAFEAMLD